MYTELNASETSVETGSIPDLHLPDGISIMAVPAPVEGADSELNSSFRINLGYEPDSCGNSDGDDENDNAFYTKSEQDECEQNNQIRMSQQDLRQQNLKINPSFEWVVESQEVIENEMESEMEKENKRRNNLNSHYIKNTKLKSSPSSHFQNGTDDGNNTKKSSETVDEKVYFGFTMSQYLLLLSCSAVNMFSLACVSLHATFYPKVAERKGASPTAAGFVFGIFQLTVFIMSLVYGSLLGKIGPKRMATTGIIVMALSSMVFGLLDRVEGATAFITLSFIVRIIQANGNAGFVTASFAIIANEFPTSVAKAISYMETAAGLGLIIGPAVGGGLYELGGFIVPFIVMGVLLLGAGILAFFFMPDVEIPDGGGEGGDKSEKPQGMISLLSIPTVTLAAFSIFAGATGIGYLLPTLEPHVNKNFDLPESFTGLIFVLDGAMYALFNPMWGWLCDKFGQPRIISLIGASLTFFGFCLIGPISFLPWKPILWVTCVGCIIFGFGLGASFVSGFVQGLVDAKSRGFPDNVATYGLVSGMWFSMMSLGSFTGSSAGGILTEHFGFQHGIYFVLGVEVLVALWTIFFIIKFRNQKNFDVNGVTNNPEAPSSNSDTKIKSVVAA